MKRIHGHKVLVILVLLLFINLPFVSALEISNVRAEDVTDTSARILWDTDDTGDSFVDYGLDTENLRTVGDAAKVTEHSIQLSELQPETEYVFSVESNEIVNDNDGNLYSFMTFAPDTDAPMIDTTLPEFVSGDTVDINGTAESGSTVKVYVNDNIAGEIVSSDGTFMFENVKLLHNQQNIIRINAEDTAGNIGTFDTVIFADTKKPVITIEDIDELVEESTVTIKGSVSENSTIEFTVNNRSVGNADGVTFEEEVNVDEGENIIIISATDKAGWTTTVEKTVTADTRAPTVRFDLTGGTEYYEGVSVTLEGVKQRAQTNINGETEPGAKVFLYIYRERGDEYRADFKRAIASTTAGEDGNFSFDGISFPPSAFPSIQDLSPREVPSGLQEILIPNLPSIGEEQRKTFHVYIIAEDQTGKTGYSQKNVHVNSCYSGSFDLDIQPITKFQAPFRLDPTLMEDGRATIQAVFNISYRGTALGETNPATLEVEEGYRIQSATFRKACTRQISEEDDYATGCKLLPNTLSAQPNGDNTAYYVTATLNRADEFSEREDDLWDDFNSKRQLKMPIKILVNYQEKEANGQWGERKTQVMCHDLGYFVDIPIDSSELVPDFLADEGVAALNWTINQIENVKPYLRTAMLVTGIGCIGSFLTKMVVRYYRVFMSYFEPWTTRLAGDDKKCPGGSGQQKLYLDSTIEHWQELGRDVPLDLTKEEHSLDTKCPSTAGAWEFESYVDQLYRWTCDRFLCRAVPAAWTSTKEEHEVEEVILKQKMCSVTGNCALMYKVENCQDKIKLNPAYGKFIERKEQEGPWSCWRDAEGTHYYRCVGRNNEPSLCGTQEDIIKLQEKDIWRLAPVEKLGDVIPEAKLVLNPENTDQVCAAVDKSCATQCKKKSGYVAVDDGFTVGKKDNVAVVSEEDRNAQSPKNVVKSKGACYLEDSDGNLKGAGSARVDGTKFASGYTKDCFIDENTGDKYQCVCEEDESKTKGDYKGDNLRTAVKEENGQAEEWQYRQARVFAESGKTIGTYYPEWRYYSGRDVSGAFGQNYALDALTPSGSANEYSTTQVNPRTQMLGAFQSMCLTQINAHLESLQSMLIGLQQCIIQAKHTGFHDAGMCKTMFTQQVCGLIYKSIAYLASDCSPLSMKDVDKGGSDEEGIADGAVAFFDSGFKAIPDAMDASIQEVREDYANSHMEQFFAAGSQGFSESLCLAAFGYDFPMGMDFIMDAANAVPSKTKVFMPVTERELTTFNPIDGTAIHNYHIAGTFIPGCSIRGYRTTLKCVGLDDLGHPNVEKGGDCLQASNLQSPYTDQRTHLIDGGIGFGGVTRRQMFDLPIESPQPISSQYRYDHVVFELFLDQGESPEACFDEGYRTSNGGIWYFPITDISQTLQAECYADLSSGRYICPEVSGFFTGGQTFFEHPFMECYNKDTEEFTDCQSPNLFIKNDPIVIKPYMYLGNEKSCLKITDTKGQIERVIELPENIAGPYAPRIQLATVSESMLSGSGIATIINVDQTVTGCGGNGKDVYISGRPGTHSSPRRFSVTVTPTQNNMFQLDVDPNVQVHSPTGGLTYGKSGNTVVVITGTTSRQELTRDEIFNAQFTVDGFTFSQVFDKTTALSTPAQCSFQTLPTDTTTQSVGTMSALRISAQLLQPGSGGSCFTAVTPMPKSSQGKTSHTQTIRVQSQRVEESIASDMYEDFKAGNYQLVIEKAKDIVQQNMQRGESSLTDVQATYYWIASYVMLGSSRWKQDYGSEIRSLLDLFFLRNYVGQTITSYPSDVKSTGEYQKVEKYFCCVAKELNVENQYSACQGSGSCDGISLDGDLQAELVCNAPTTKYKVIVSDGTGLEINKKPQAGLQGNSKENMPDNAEFDVCNNPKQGTWAVVSFNNIVGWSNIAAQYAKKK